MNNVFHKDYLDQKQNSMEENKSEKDCNNDEFQFPKSNDLKTNFVQNRKICKDCLSKGHQLDACSSKFTC